MAKHWVKSSILEWKCRTTGRVIWKRAGGAKLEVDDSTSGYSVFSGKSYKVSTNSIVNDNNNKSNVLYFEIKLLSNVDTNDNCTFFRIGWMFNPINDSNEKDIADTKKESINKK